MLAVAGEHAHAAAKLIDEEFLDGLDPEARQAAGAIIDLDADENACPACGGKLASIPGRCPDCGLNIG